MDDMPQEVIQQTHQVLRNLLKPARLTEVPWLERQIAQQRAINPDASSIQALKAVFEDALKALAGESAEYADILQGRYWEGLTVSEMVFAKRPRVYETRSFHLRQKEAIQRLAQILWEREQVCKRSAESTPPEAAPEPAPTMVVPAVQRPAVRPPILVGLLGGILVLAVAAVALLNSRSMQAVVQPLSPTGTSSSGSSPTSTTAGICGETERITAPPMDRLVRSQGVSLFDKVNTADAMLSDEVRSLAIDSRGLWAGYFTMTPVGVGGVGHYDKATWAHCLVGTPGVKSDVNALAIDTNGYIWAATERNGVAYFDGAQWRYFTVKDGLPSDQTYSVTVGPDGAVWVGTWEGIARYDGQSWSVPYSTANRTIANNHVIAVVFSTDGDIWVGHINDGISYYDHAARTWTAITARTGSLSGNKVRSILLRPSPQSTAAPAVWIATADGGISVLDKGAWTSYRAGGSLPSDDVRVLVLDRYNRVWAGTAQGTVYFDGTAWQTYHTYDTLSIAIGPTCQNCPFDTDHVWTGTAAVGLTHSRIPLPDDVVDVVSVNYPKVVAPGEVFYPEITVAPRAPYELREARGDFLSNTDASDANLFGAYRLVPVKGTITAGHQYMFVDHDNPMRAPQLAEGETQHEYTSTWRVWMFTRYVGPPIKITFIVRRPEATPTP